MSKYRGVFRITYIIGRKCQDMSKISPSPLLPASFIVTSVIMTSSLSNTTDVRGAQPAEELIYFTRREEARTERVSPPFSFCAFHTRFPQKDSLGSILGKVVRESMLITILVY